MNYLSQLQSFIQVALVVALSSTTLSTGARSQTPAAGGASDRSIGKVANIPHQLYKLPNGLTVILVENHSTPTLSVNVRYHVGSRNEKVGRTGLAHLFEHVMFMGSGHAPYGTHERLTEGVGGGNNAWTENDCTDYFETVPSNYLEAQLWLESDRMGFLLDSLTQAKLDAQRDVVKNERRQSVDNKPYGHAHEIIYAALYPEGHPYHWPISGSMSDLSAASLQDAKHFFQHYYAPNNATLVISGDFAPAQARRWVAKYFGGIPHGTPITRSKAAPITLLAEKRLEYQDRVSVPRLTITWPSVGEVAPDHVVLDALSDVLAGSRTARLTKVLVYDRRWASSLTASQETMESAGTFSVTMTPTPGHTLAQLEAAADSIIDQLRRDGPTADEVRRATAGSQTKFIKGLESNLGKAEKLADGQAYHNDANYYKKELALIQSLTPAAVQRAANRYLTNGRIVLSIVPKGRLQDASKADLSTEIK